MENRIYLIVRAVAAGYILYKLWRLLFDGGLGGFWDWVFRNAPQQAARKTAASRVAGSGTPATGTTNALRDVVGRTHTVYLEDPRAVTPVTEVMSQPLEPSDFIGEEPPTAADEVEATLPPPTQPHTLEEPIRFEDTGDDGVPPDEDFDRCLTYEQMNEAMEVLAGRTADERRNLRAATAIYGVRNSDLFDFFITQAGSEQAVETLLAEYLDESGEPLLEEKRKSGYKRTEGFNINKYV